MKKKIVGKLVDILEAVSNAEKNTKLGFGSAAAVLAGAGIFYGAMIYGPKLPQAEKSYSRPLTQAEKPYSRFSNPEEAERYFNSPAAREMAEEILKDL